MKIMRTVVTRSSTVNFAVFVLIGILSDAVEQHRNDDNHLNGCTADAAPALGMESGSIKDAQLTASSSFDSFSVGQQNARIRTEKASGAWCPKQQIRDDSAEYLQIDLRRPYLLHAVETQGRYGNGTGREFVESYFVDYSLGVNVTWTRHRSRSGDSLMAGNIDTVTSVKRRLDPPIVARLVRVVPYSAQTRTACLRLELYGCPHSAAVTVSPTNNNAYGAPIDEESVYVAPFSTQHYLLLAGLGVTVIALCLFVCILIAVYHTIHAVPLKYSRKSKCHHDALTRKLRVDGTKSARDAFAPFFSTQPPPPARANLVATLGGTKNGGPPRNLLQRLDTTFQLPIAWTNDEEGLEDMENDEAECYATVQLHRGAPKSKPSIVSTINTLPNSGTLSSCCSISADDTSASSTAQRRIGGPSLRDFHFPPPPSAPPRYRILNRTADENIYTEPAIGIRSTESFVPATRDGDRSYVAPAGHKSHSARSHRRPLPRPPRASATLDQIRGAVDFSDGTLSLPKQLVKTMSPESGIGSDSRNCLSQCSNHSQSHSKPTMDSNRFALHNVPHASLRVDERLGGGKLTDVHAVVLIGHGGRRLALKTIRSGLDPASLSAARQALIVERRILSTIRHSNIVAFAGECDDGAILTECAEWADLQTALAAGQLRLAGCQRVFLFICAQLADALAYLESRQIVHGHFSTRSCLLSGSSEAPHVRIASPRGSNLHAQLRYSAPEAIILNEWSNKTDVWSFGVTAWVLAHAARRQPFDSLTNAQLHANARRILERSDDAVLLDFDSLPKDSVENMVRNELALCSRPAPFDRPDFRRLASFFHSKLNS